MALRSLVPRFPLSAFFAAHLGISANLAGLAEVVLSLSTLHTYHKKLKLEHERDLSLERSRVSSSLKHVP